MNSVKSKIFTFLGIFLFLLMLDVPHAWLFDPDETRYAAIPQEMVLSHDYLTPRLNGSHYFEKPPLLYWLNAGALKLFGPTPYAMRLSVRLATIGTALLLFLFLSSFGNDAGLWAALVFISSPMPFLIGRINITDGILSFGMTLTLLSLWKFIGKPTKYGFLLIALGTAIAFLAKGLIAVVLPGLILFTWCALMNQWKPLLRLLFSWTLLLALLIIAPWFVLMEKTNPGFSYIFFVREHLLRYATDQSNRTGSLFYFVPVLLLGLIPWIHLLPSILRPFITKDLSRLRANPSKLFFLIWVFVIFGFFSISHSKLIPYLLPAFPACAALIGLYLSEKCHTHKNIFLTLGCWALMAFVMVLSVPHWAKKYSTHSLAQRALQENPEIMLCYKTYVHGFTWEFKKPLPVVDYQGELATDNILSPDLFWTQEKFWDLWRSRTHVIAVFRKNQKPVFENEKSTVRWLAENHRFVLASNY